MPSTGTPSVRGDVVVNEIDASNLPHSFCPPEDDRNDSWMQEQIRINAERVENDVSQSRILISTGRDPEVVLWQRSIPGVRLK